jgi:hypothetical protein
MHNRPVAASRGLSSLTDVIRDRPDILTGQACEGSIPRTDTLRLTFVSPDFMLTGVAQPLECRMG